LFFVSVQAPSQQRWFGVAPQTTFSAGLGSCALQLPPAHVSAPLHMTPSSHGAELLELTQPDGSQLSSVQRLSSSHPTGTQLSPQHSSRAPHVDSRTQVSPSHRAVSQPLDAHVVPSHTEY